jgi:transcriptional regulator with XRE-family HTH domain
MLVQKVGEVLQKRRRELKITQPDLANLAGISVNTLYKVERGNANPTLEVLEKLLEVLGLELKITPKMPLSHNA